VYADTCARVFRHHGDARVIFTRGITKKKKNKTQTSARPFVVVVPYGRLSGRSGRFSRVSYADDNHRSPTCVRMKANPSAYKRNRETKINQRVSVSWTNARDTVLNVKFTKYGVVIYSLVGVIKNLSFVFSVIFSTSIWRTVVVRPKTVWITR